MQNSYYINPENLLENYTAKFCFITSSYNQSQFIDENIASIFLQDYETYRIIYINDASTDNSLDILNKLFIIICLKYYYFRIVRVHYFSLLYWMNIMFF